jgi:hemophore-related protein
MLDHMRRRVAMAVCAGAATGATLLVASPLASANEDPGANPPNCSAADLQNVKAGVDAATASYLFAHPDLNDFMTSLKGMSREDVTKQVAGWMTSHPQEQTDMNGIRQPLMDLKNRCGSAPNP